MQHRVVRGGSSGEQVQPRTSLIVVTGPKQTEPKRRNGHKVSSCDAALPVNMHRRPSVTLCPATCTASLFSAPSAVSERDDGKVPADPIMRPTSQACESTNAHRRSMASPGADLQTCMLSGAAGRGGVAICPVCFFFILFLFLFFFQKRTR